MEDEYIFADLIRDVTEKRMRFVLKYRELLVEAWLAETGLKPSENELVEQVHGDGTVTVHVRRLEHD